MTTRSVSLRRGAPLSAGGRGTDLLVLCLLAPVLAIGGALVSSLSSQHGSGKVVWVMLALFGALVSLLDLRIALSVLALGLAFPFRTKLLFGYDVHTTHLLLLVIAVLFFLGMLGGRLRVARGMAVPVAVMLFGAVVGSIAGPDTGPALFRATNGLLLPLLAGLAAAAALKPRRDLRTLVVIVAVSLTATSLLALLQETGHAPGPLAPSFEKGRVNGLFFHPNILGGYLAANILLLLGVAGYAWRRFPLAPLVFLGPIFLGIAGLYVTLSRGALIGLAAGVLVIMVLMIARRQVLSVMAVVLMVVLTLVVAIPRVPESERANFAARFQKLLKPGAETGRSLLYHEAFRVIKANPVTGVGPLTFGAMENRRSAIPLLDRGLTHAHNIFLEGFLSLGPIGLLAFLALLWAAVRRLFSATRGRAADLDPIVAGWAIGSLGALTSMVVQGMADFLFWQVEFLTLLALILGAAFAIGALDRDEPGHDAA